MKLIYLLILLITNQILSAQNLTVSETTEYIKNLVNGEISVQKDGEVKMEFQDNRRNSKFIQGIIFNINDIELLDYKYIDSTISEFGIKIKCKENNTCLKCYDVENFVSTTMHRERECGLYGVNDNSEKSSKKLKNALEYLKDIAIKEGYNKIEDDINDPFSNENYIPIATKLTSRNNIENENIKLQKSGNLYYLNILINGQQTKFILDSGASDLTINEDLEKILIDKKLIKKEDYLSSALYKIADGSIISNRRLILKNIKIGNFTIENVRVAVSKGDSPLLLGKSLLDNFSNWSIDNKNMTLKLHR